MNKNELRQIYRAKRMSLSPDKASDLSRRIADMFFLNTDLVGTRILHGFIPIKKFNEIDTSLIFERLWHEFSGILTLAPHINVANGEMQSSKFSADTELKENAWGIREPVGGTAIDASNVDVVLVPLLCFDTRGHRVGYGKGFYDRFLSKCRPGCVKIGLSFFSPVEEITDADGRDIKIDRCITPDKIYRFEGDGR